MEWVETTGRTLAEATDAALEQLGVAEDDAEVVVVSEPKVGLFGRMRGEARVRARVRPVQARPKRGRERRSGGGRGGGRRSGASGSAEAASAPGTDEAGSAPNGAAQVGAPRKSGSSTRTGGTGRAASGASAAGGTGTGGGASGRRPAGGSGAGAAGAADPTDDQPARQGAATGRSRNRRVGATSADASSADGTIGDGASNGGPDRGSSTIEGAASGGKRTTGRQERRPESTGDVDDASPARSVATEDPEEDGAGESDRAGTGSARRRRGSRGRGGSARRPADGMDDGSVAADELLGAGATTSPEPTDGDGTVDPAGTRERAGSDPGVGQERLARPVRQRSAARGVAEQHDVVAGEHDAAPADGTEKEDPVGEMTLQQQGDAARTFVSGLVERLGLDASVEVRTTSEDTVSVAVEGTGLGTLVGPGGTTLAALQELTRTYVQKITGGQSDRILVDVAGYRAKRVEALQRFTKSIAAEVVASGEARALEPMSAADRKVVHDTINEIDGVTTRSEGEDPHRHIVLVPGTDQA